MSQTVTERAAELLGPWVEPINVALDRCLQLDDGCPDRLRDAMRYSLLAPGKRLRPALVLMATEACNGDSQSAMPAACAVEMIHAYSLVHDDLPAMDDDDLRRGRPTCHKQFDEATAILAGDALLTLAFETVARDLRPAEVATACCGCLARAAGARHLVGGQADDLAMESSRPNLAALESIHRRKTGALIAASVKMGGIVAGADERRLALLEEYGRCLGLAFQVTDDLLDVSGNEAAMGKRVRKDESRGKATYPGLIGVEESSSLAKELVERACDALADFGSRAAGLEATARYVLERNH